LKLKEQSLAALAPREEDAAVVRRIEEAFIERAEPALRERLDIYTFASVYEALRNVAKAMDAELRRTGECPAHQTEK
jgi:hypothetical protein